MNLRPYQQHLVTEIRGQYQLGRRSVLAVLPTGGGKTVCFAHIAQAASIKGNRVLILVHRAELLDQASRAMPVPHGIIAANRAMDLSHTVQVASVQTVARRLHLLISSSYWWLTRRITPPPAPGRVSSPTSHKPSC
jgi:DNA repair protein RadD